MSHALVEGSTARPQHAGIGLAEAADSHIASVAYRPDIDGLRGIAVALVIAFHFGIWPVGGGYIGVDIFFVISGYLITSLLAQTSGGMFVVLNDFYRRRIIRLMPMFLIVAFTAAIAATFLFVPDDYVSYFRSVTQGLVFRANDHFDHVTRDYFSSDARDLPLLHTWSLSIEWQFYLLFPAFFLVARKLLSQSALIAVLCCLGVGLFAVSCQQTGDTQQAYLLGSARYFEPLMGCIAAFVRLPLGRSLRTALVTLSLVLLIGLSLVYSEATPFPGWYAGSVCLLAAIVVIAGQGTPVLGFRPLVHLGKISYSAYLWHWPPLAFLAYTQTPVSGPMKVLLIAGILIAAHLSYIWIERPSKALRDWPLWRLAAVFVILPLTVSVSAKEISEHNDGFPQRLGSEAVSIHQALLPYLDRDNCLYFRRNEGAECRLGNSQAAPSFYLIGDSHAGHYRWFVDTLAKDAEVSGISVTSVQCLMAPGTLSFSSDEHCRNTTQTVYDKIEQARPKYVVIGERWIIYPPQDLEKMGAAIGTLVERGMIPIILGPIAETGQNLRSCFYKHVRLRAPYRGECRFNPDNGFAKDEVAHVQRFFETLKAKYPAVKIIDVRSAECPSGRCDAQIDGVPIYEDNNHINGYGSVMLARRYLAQFGNPLRP